MHKNYLKNGRRIVSVLALTAMTHLSYAQMDVTRFHLVNPSFEINGAEGWDIENFENTGISDGARKQVALEKAAGKGYFEGNEAIEKWVSADKAQEIGKFDVSQTITGLPAGKYKFSVGAKGLNQGKLNSEVHNLYLYANDDKVMISTPVLEDESNLLRANEPVSEFFIVETEIGDNGTIKFGFASRNDLGENELYANWLCFDNFRMYIQEASDMKFLYNLYIGNLLEKYSTEERITGEYREKLQRGGEFDTLKDELYANPSSTEAEFKELYETVLTVIDEAETTRSIMNALFDKIAEGYDLLDAHTYPGADDYAIAVDEAETVYYKTGMTVADIEAAIAMLEEAKIEFLKSGLEDATLDNPVLVVGKIVNPTIEEGTTPNDFNTVTGWVCSNSGTNGRYLCFSGSNVMLEAWNGTASTIEFDYYQDLEDLPIGSYSLKASARGSQGTPNGNAVIYASSTKEKHTSILNPTLIEGVEGGEDDLSSYDVIDVVVVTGKLRIGFKNIGVLTNNWTVCDNFELYYNGSSHLTADDYVVALQDVIGIAKELGNDANILPVDLEILNAAVTEAEGKLTASKDEIVDAILVLQSAVKVAEESVKICNDFMEVTCVKLAEFNNDTYTELNTISEAMLDAIYEKFAMEGTSVSDVQLMDEQVMNLLSYFDEYVAAMREVADGAYDFELTEAFEKEVQATAESLSTGDLNAIDKAREDIVTAITNLRNNGITSGNDYTSWIINNEFEEDLKGWVNDGMDIQNNDAFKEKTNTKYCQKWTGSGSIADADVHQTIIVPNGLYTISVNASATGGEAVNGEVEGINFYVKNGDASGFKYSLPVKTQYLVPAVTEIKKEPIIDVDGNPVLDENGEPTFEEVEVVITPAELTYKIQVAVTGGKVTFGMESVKSTCSYLRFDNFRLVYDGVIPTGIEDVNAETPFYVTVKGNQIYVIGAENYTVYTVNGQTVSAQAELTPGVYIVNANGKSVKVIVK